MSTAHRRLGPPAIAVLGLLLLSAPVLAGCPAVAGGSHHAMALADNGSAWAWGYDNFGQLGTGTNTNTTLPVQVRDASGVGFLADVMAISGGAWYSLALKSDGTVWAWGDTFYGQLGDGTNTASNVPVRVRDPSGVGFLSGIAAISSGARHALALKGDGTVWAWGDNYWGQLGIGTFGWSSGSNLPVQVKDPSGTGILTGVTSIKAGQDHALALKGDGSVWAWGYNLRGQLGIGTTADSHLPIQVLDSSGGGFMSGVSALSGGGRSFSLVLKGDGTVWAWGENFYGQLGDGMNADTSLPVQVRDPSGTGFLSGITAIAGGGTHSLALKNDGTLWTWGENLAGALGDGTNIHSNLPVQVRDSAGTGFLSGVTAVGDAIGGGGDYSLAVTGDGSIWAWGYNADGELGNGTILASNLPVRVRDPSGAAFLDLGTGVDCSNSDLDLQIWRTSAPVVGPGGIVNFDVQLTDVSSLPLIDGLLGDTLDDCFVALGVAGNPCPTGPGAPSVTCVGPACVGASCTLSNGGLGFLYSGINLAATDGAAGGGDELTISIRVLAGSNSGACTDLVGIADPTDGVITDVANVVISIPGDCLIASVLQVQPFARTPPWVYTNLCSVGDQRLDNTSIVSSMAPGAFADTFDSVAPGPAGNLLLYQLDCGCDNDIYLTKNATTSTVTLYVTP